MTFIDYKQMPSLIYNLRLSPVSAIFRRKSTARLEGEAVCIAAAILQ